MLVSNLSNLSIVRVFIIVCSLEKYKNRASEGKDLENLEKRRKALKELLDQERDDYEV